MRIEAGERTPAHAHFAHFRRAIGLIVLALASAHASASEPFDLARYRGKVVILDFWASWCAPCRRSFPWLNEIQARYAGDGLVVVGVNVDADRAAAERFLREVPAQFEIVYDPDGTLAAKYELLGMPSSFIFGPRGELLSSHIGFKNAARAEREAEIAALLQSERSGSNFDRMPPSRNGAEE